MVAANGSRGLRAWKSVKCAEHMITSFLSCNVDCNLYFHSLLLWLLTLFLILRLQTTTTPASRYYHYICYYVYMFFFLFLHSIFCFFSQNLYKYFERDRQKIEIYVHMWHTFHFSLFGAFIHEESVCADTCLRYQRIVSNTSYFLIGIHHISRNAVPNQWEMNSIFHDFIHFMFFIPLLLLLSTLNDEMIFRVCLFFHRLRVHFLHWRKFSIYIFEK